MREPATPQHRISITGLVLSGVYVAASLACIALGLSAGDPKATFVMLQLPIALQMSAMHDLGMTRALETLDWFTAYAMIGGGTVVLLYGAGALTGQTVRYVLGRVD
ncbi:hypothetical protein [Azospirillum sp. SYSU D00513]|uniref:hypothetical protein n=1 Tax=Azospirillum sp. SYSU D00513 TaxID=2812561 RepID=UPI001A962B15|nr:hypothetical protein [Azospirillum sp. SYSU D00513]